MPSISCKSIAKYEFKTLGFLSTLHDLQSAAARKFSRE